MKKRILSLVIAAVCMAILGTPALADGTTTITAVVPEASYTMTVPEDTAITYGEEYTDAGNLKVVASSGFDVGKNVKVNISIDDFTSESTTTTIPCGLRVCPSANLSHAFNPGVKNVSVLFVCNATNKLLVVKDDKMTLDSDSNANAGYYTVAVLITGESWGKAAAGDYTSSITFTAQVVAAE